MIGQQERDNLCDDVMSLIVLEKQRKWATRRDSDKLFIEDHPFTDEAQTALFKDPVRTAL